jgi:hypothetical protein
LPTSEVGKEGSKVGGQGRILGQGKKEGRGIGGRKEGRARKEEHIVTEGRKEGRNDGKSYG